MGDQIQTKKVRQEYSSSKSVVSVDYPT